MADKACHGFTSTTQVGLIQALGAHMETLGTSLILLGLLIVYASQLYGAVMIFKSSVFKGILTLIVPFYFIVVLKTSGKYWAVMGPALFGIALIAAGTIIHS